MPLGIPAPGDYGSFRMLGSQETMDLFGYPFDVVQWNTGQFYQIGPNLNPGQSVNVIRTLTPQYNNNGSFSIPSVAQSPFDVSPSDGDMRFEVSGFLGGGAGGGPIPGGFGAASYGGGLQPAPGPSSQIVEGVSTALATTQAGVMTPAAGSGVPWKLILVASIIVWAIFAKD